jgi:hypothetical protein
VSFTTPDDSNAAVSVQLSSSQSQPFLITSAELWQGQAGSAASVELRKDVVLVQASASRSTTGSGSSGVAKLNIIAPGDTATKYTATLDVYARPYGSNPQGHYGYWSVALNAGTSRDLQFSLDLPHKQMQTQLGSAALLNYPPDPKDLDINSYAKIGDFRASLNIYQEAQFVGSVRLFDFTVSGDKNDAANRRVTDFVGYDTAVTYLVLKP